MSEDRAAIIKRASMARGEQKISEAEKELTAWLAEHPEDRLYYGQLLGSLRLALEGYRGD